LLRRASLLAQDREHHEMARAQTEWRNRRFRPQAHQACEMVEER
jgi:hypothetical protein